MAVHITRAGVALTVGIIVVTGLIIAGLFWIRGAGEQARQDEATKIAEQQLEEQSRNDVALNEGDKESANKDESQSSTEQQGTTNNSSEQGTSSQASTNTSGSNSSTNTNGAAGGTTELPRTGAGDMAPAAILAVLTFSIVSYVASRRHLSQY